MPARVVLQDFTGVPCVVDLAAMRDAMARMKGDPDRINPVVPCDLVIDHSVQVDHYGSDNAFRLNVELELERNVERYQLLKFAQRAFHNFRVVPPGTGIVHQVNLEYLAPVVQLREQFGELTAYPDTLVGTDSHTTMINGLGVMGWGVGGIEAEAVMLGQPYFMLIPEVVGDEADRRAAPRHHRDRPGAHRDPDAPEEGRGGQVRRVLRPRTLQPRPGRPGHHRQHGARVRRHDGLLPGGRGDAPLPRAHRPEPRGRRAGRALLQGAGPLPHRRHARIPVFTTTLDLDLAHASTPSLAGPAPAAGPGAAGRAQAELRR